MGRAFEYRKDRKFKRWAAMSKAFTKIGKEIAISVKLSGPDPLTNPRLRMAIQNSKAVNMPKATVEASIKKATSKDEKDFEEVVYEGYGPHGVAILIEVASDNTTRTVANLRMYFSRYGGSLGVTGSVNYMFEHKGEFRFPLGAWDPEELEMELIDHGAEDFQVDGEEVYVYTAFEDFGMMQKALEDRNIELTTANLQWFPTTTKELTPEQQEDLEKLLFKFEDDDDVQQVFHTMA